MYCNRCKKRTRHKYSYTNKTQKRKALVYIGCSCGVSLSLIGYLDDNKTIVKFNDVHDCNKIMREWHVKYLRERHTNPKKARSREYKKVKERIKEFEDSNMILREPPHEQRST
jgi:hypothetical protein